jgi:hypothetical protein
MGWRRSGGRNNVSRRPCDVVSFRQPASVALVAWGLALLSCLAACGDSASGLHLFVRTGTVQYDELRFAVALLAADETSEIVERMLVDPATRGRFVAPFKPGDQDVLVYLPAELAGRRVRCEIIALLASATVGTDHEVALLESQRMKRVYLALTAGFDGGGSDSASGGGGEGGAGGTIGMGEGGRGSAGAAATGTGGTGAGGAGAGTTGGGGAGRGGTSGVGRGGSGGGAAGGSHAGGMGGMLPPGGRNNGDPCSDKVQCSSDHCADGVCCESDCDKECDSCALPATKGLCRKVAAGTPDPRGKCVDKGPGECQTDGRCGIAGQCSNFPAGTVCQPATCENNGAVALSTRTCDGSGKCLDPEKTSCISPATCTSGVCR